ncbi:MAG: hypothetical protein N4A59_09610, partial [Marinifilum sp.]|nr:hypothetical protein [Marinifilum sp.]
MKLHLFVILSCIGVFSIQAQDPVDHSQSQILTDVVLPSPSVAALSKFVDIPVGYYTGVPNISIPFGELRGREISVPISISYHASGVRVSDIPGWVGSGWALNAGGVISRTMVGFPDEKAGVGYFDMIDEMPAADDPYFYSWVPETDTEKRQVAEGQWDLQPDMFTYSFNGQSGKFAFSVEADGSVTARTIPYRNIKIEPDWSNKRWTITTEDGTKYVFGTTLDGSRNAYETNHGDGEGSHAFVSAWHLMEIISLNDTDRMDFYYGAVQELYDISESETRYNSINSGDSPVLGPDWTSFRPNINPTYKIEKIESFNGSVVFGKNAGREDMYNNKGCMLSSIEFRDEKDEMYRKFELIHGYINSTWGDYKRKRLRLDRVTEIDSYGDSKPPYIFTYNEDRTLPARDSKSIDHWGYYNGVNNSTLIPEMDLGYKVLSGGNRESNHEFIKAGVLEKITYPTGGDVTFEYEGHEYGSNSRGLVNEIIYKDVTKSFSLDKRTNYSQPDEVFYSFEIPFKQYADCVFRLESGLPEVNAFVEIMDSDDNQIAVSSQIAQQYVYFQADTYKVRIFAMLKELAKVRITYKKKMTDENGNIVYKKRFPAGGLRIKKITTYDGFDHSKDIIRKFEYNSRTDSERSSGRLLVKNKYDYSYKIPRIVNQPPNNIPQDIGTYTYIVRTSSNMNQNSSSSHICYSNVREIKGDNGEGGFTDYYYDYYGDVACR